MIIEQFKCPTCKGEKRIEVQYYLKYLQAAKYGDRWVRFILLCPRCGATGEVDWVRLIATPSHPGIEDLKTRTDICYLSIKPHVQEIKRYKPRGKRNV